MVEFLERDEFDDSQAFLRIALILDEMRAIGELEAPDDDPKCKQFCKSETFRQIQKVMRVQRDTPELKKTIEALIHTKIVFSEESELFF